MKWMQFPLAPAALEAASLRVRNDDGPCGKSRCLGHDNLTYDSCPLAQSLWASLVNSLGTYNPDHSRAAQGEY